MSLINHLMDLSSARRQEIIDLLKKNIDNLSGTDNEQKLIEDLFAKANLSDLQQISIEEINSENFQQIFEKQDDPQWPLAAAWALVNKKILCTINNKKENYQLKFLFLIIHSLLYKPCCITFDKNFNTVPDGSSNVNIDQLNKYWGDNTKILPTTRAESPLIEKFISIYASKDPRNLMLQSINSSNQNTSITAWIESSKTLIVNQEELRKEEALRRDKELQQEESASFISRLKPYTTQIIILTICALAIGGLTSICAFIIIGLTIFHNTKDFSLPLTKTSVSLISPVIGFSDIFERRNQSQAVDQESLYY